MSCYRVLCVVSILLPCVMCCEYLVTVCYVMKMNVIWLENNVNECCETNDWAVGCLRV